MSFTTSFCLQGCIHKIKNAVQAVLKSSWSGMVVSLKSKGLLEHQWENHNAVSIVTEAGLEHKSECLSTTKDKQGLGLFQLKSSAEEQ
ncbi:hypothetical protein P4O66_008472, partial [Electrophorus voltai]